MRKKNSPIKNFFKAIYSMRGLLLSLPVVAAAVLLAVHNYSIFGPTVGIFLRDDGSYWMTLPRLAAILVPGLITAVCIVLTCLSKKVFYPWLISIFTLVLPLLLWVLTVFGL